MKFKNININKILYELLRSDLSINLSQKLSIFYKYLLACLYPLQISFDNFFVWRKKEFIISNCHWENGNLTNVLNLLFDNEFNSIFITSNFPNTVLAPPINSATATTVFAPPINSAIATTVLLSPIDSPLIYRGIVTIHIPNYLYVNETVRNEIIATIEQIRFTGIRYEITYFEPISAPILTTTSASSITSTTATSGGNVTSDGGSSVTARGVCWSLSVNPTLSDSHTSDGSGTGIFTSSITGLTQLTTYHIRAYATNSVGTSYGSDLTFLTISSYTAPILADYTTGDNFYNDSQAGIRHIYIISSNGGSAITEYGYVTATHTAPLISDNKFIVASTNYVGDVNNIYSRSNFVTSLIHSSTYYVRPYATNAIGTTYGTERIILAGNDTNCNIYSTQVIGTQTWIKFNIADLKTASGSTPDIKFPNNDISNLSQYGGLYKWSDANLLAPTGWHLPTITECDTLSNYLGGNNVSGGKLKDTGDTHWNSGNTGATNSALFYSRGAGWVSPNGTAYNDFRATQYIWTTTLDSGVNYFRFKQSSNAITSATEFSGDKDNYYSVRLIKD